MKTKQFYLDHNSTSPLSKKVKHFLKGGEVDFFNPNSLHPLGQSSHAVVYEVTQFLHDYFRIPSDEFFLIYHSGVTEGLNLLAHHFAEDKLGEMKCFISDHPCAYEQAQRFKSSQFELISTNSDFEFESCKFSENPTLLNWTVVNNLSGHVFDYQTLKKFKNRFIQDNNSVFVHIDAAQLIGKTELKKEVFDLLNIASFISFSGHKFGALKGVGFSFIHNTWKKKMNPFLYGGEQNYKIRASTMNTLGIYSLKLALEEQREKADMLVKVEELRNEMKNLLEQDKQWILPFSNFKTESVNTLSFCHHSLASDRLLPAFYAHGLYVSPGSACTSGAAKPNFYLEELGHKHLAKNLIRVSLGAENLENKAEILGAFTQVLENIRKM
ncbi:aminotransferase class V-fold PLP-dependent enzyme [Bacteriovoracaceae bacterium]|nr:aminotransferase class V-fold PLP-dependent enzyme [Bacteriovoracaceae bacterium]